MKVNLRMIRVGGEGKGSEGRRQQAGGRWQRAEERRRGDAEKRRRGEEEIRGQKSEDRGCRNNAHCAFINYHLAFYLNFSISVICEFSMINAKCEMTIEFLSTTDY